MVPGTEAMKLPRITFPNLICFLLPLAIALTFPMQVMTGATAAGSLSLLLQLALIGTLLVIRRIPKLALSKARSVAVWDPIVSAWLFVVLINIPISWLTFGPGAMATMTPTLYLIVQGALLYFYFSRVAGDDEIRSFFAGMVVMGIISGAFFVFDTFYKLALGRVTTYALKAHAYSTAAGGLIANDPGVSKFRINAVYRSFGLLERHSTSALWVAFGWFAYVSVTANAARKRIGFGFALATLLIGQNFTSIVAFGSVSFLLYRRYVRVRSLWLPLLLTVPVMLIYRDKIAPFVGILWYLLRSQLTSALTTNTSSGDYSYLAEVVSSIRPTINELLMRPNELIFGFGMGSNPYYGTSGDEGFLEAILRLGIPLWVFFTYTLVRLVRAAMRRRTADAKIKDNLDSTLLTAAAAILASTWLMDLHYTAWPNKSVWPMLFFGMALARRVGRPRNSLPDGLAD
jgi:hypothetical protein